MYTVFISGYYNQTGTRREMCVSFHRLFVYDNQYRQIIITYDNQYKNNHGLTILE